MKPKIKIPDFANRLPESIRSFTQKGVYDAGDNQHLSFIQGSGHGGSHRIWCTSFSGAWSRIAPPSRTFTNP
ncbi:MAG: hypothetical protein JNM63_12500 [Spirochaetia bacterium]|nr:hypothetical protein [Spirochaetia bacterium]